MSIYHTRPGYQFKFKLSDNIERTLTPSGLVLPDNLDSEFVALATVNNIPVYIGPLDSQSDLITPITGSSGGSLGGLTFADQYSSFTAALAATPSGGRLWLNPNTAYTVSSGFTISKPCRIFGNGSIFTITGTGTLFTITSSGVWIDNIRAVGPGHTTRSGSSCFVKSVGTVATPYKDLRVENCDVSEFQEDAIYFQHVDGFRVARNNFHSLYYAGFIGLSVFNGVIEDNDVADVYGTPLAYGISVNREQLDTLAAAPRSKDIRIIGNRIRRVINWEGLDVHAGDSIQLIDNLVEDCAMGIICTRSVNVADVELWAPINITVARNRIRSTSATLRAITLQGARAAGNVEGSPVERATGTIVDNFVTGYGDPTSANDGAIYLHSSRGLRISRNVLDTPGTTGITVYYDNVDIDISENTVIDPWTDTGGVVGTAIRLRTTGNNAAVVRNRLIRGTKTATSVAAYGLRVDNAGSTARMLLNEFGSATVAVSGGPGTITTT